MDTDEFITEMNNNEEYGRIFNIMVRGRSLLLELEGRDPDDGPMTVATSLLHPKPRFRLTWNNVTDRVPIMRIEANYILRGLRTIDRRIDRVEPTGNQRKKADSFIISLKNYLTETAATAMPITYNIDSSENSDTDSDSDSDSDTEARGLRKRKRKRKRKSIKTKSRKSRKSRKLRKSRKSKR